MGLVDKEVVREIPKIEGIDILGVQAFVDRGERFPVGLYKEVLRVPVLEHAELRHARPDHGHSPAQFPSSFHKRPPSGWKGLTHPVLIPRAGGSARGVPKI